MTELLALAESTARLVTETDEPIEPPLNELFARIRGLEPRVLNEVIYRLFAAAADDCPPGRGVYLYLFTGVLIERGARAELGWDRLQKRLGDGLRILAGAADRLANAGVNLDSSTIDADADAEPEVNAWLSAFRLFVVAAMARLARSAEIRAKFRADSAVESALHKLQAALPSHHGYYLTEILSLYDGPLLLVDAIAQKMTILDVRAVRNCAHLFALLEGADDVALGSNPKSNYEVRHHYASFGCLDERPRMFSSPRLVDADWIFLLGVELAVDGIPAMDVPGLGNMRIVVKAPRRLGKRMFPPADFFAPIHEACRGSVTRIRTLSRGEHRAAASFLVDAAKNLRAHLARTNGNAPAPKEMYAHPEWRAHWSKARYVFDVVVDLEIPAN